VIGNIKLGRTDIRSWQLLVFQSKMARMTEEEAAYWDEYYTKNPPKVDPAKKGGYFTRQRE
jgi:hypothetical protein